MRRVHGAKQDGLERSLARGWNAAVVASSLCLENACIEVNGKGVLLISEPLALERNPGRSRDELERALLDIPGVSKVIWLGDGLAQDPLEMSTIEGRYVGLGAGGHTDEFVRFADPRTMLLAWVEEDRVGEHPLNRINRRTNAAELRHPRARDRSGRPAVPHRQDADAGRDREAGSPRLEGGGIQRPGASPTSPQAKDDRPATR